MQLPTKSEMDDFALSQGIEPVQNTMIVFQSFGKKKGLLSLVMQPSKDDATYEERPYKLVVGADRMVLQTIDEKETFVYYKVQIEHFELKKKHYKYTVRFIYEGEPVVFYVMIDGAGEMSYSSKHLKAMVDSNWLSYLHQ